ncbi:hypothetical protein AGABI1DRAFT_114557 [Agaricus bisporus var. burnettii JB137-S8]|uniref:Uncharacterized protein n=1 Tax=Agaricus bisporus var. burnettii (strain JB137-S8 / ATCC MYA-4627 / FGSC 10392) TaxID=597362 RepID=K5X5H6_AGABU|nr:uncharacterized protein AGABI1DRAFT_114557 [Agaricus bisporus var. burnettii JB137-S8]EKM78187.1 hypothetical protein AGABI1DRAFT_114557 [Agaricus bisporus var. burnettii JB137-S8]
MSSTRKDVEELSLAIELSSNIHQIGNKKPFAFGFNRRISLEGLGRCFAEFRRWELQ